MLAFSTPLWVALLGGVVRNVSHYARPLAWVSDCSESLRSPLPSLLQGGGGALAYGMLIIAAIAWAVSIVFVRGHRFSANPAALAPWQTLVAAGLLLPIALATEATRPSISTRASSRFYMSESSRQRSRTGQ